MNRHALPILVTLVWFSQVVAQFQGGDTGVGYIDSSIVRNQIRFRYDSAYDSPTPYRAEFLYPKSSAPIGGVADPNAPGPPLPETGIDFQEFRFYAESLLVDDLISGFIEVPFRLINPDVNENAAGISDIQLGLKAALLTSDQEYLTFQFRTSFPTGDGSKGLGTETVRLEPGLLFLKRLSSGTLIEGEVRDIIPIGGTNWAGNVLRYGVGVSQPWFFNESYRFSPVVETVAWSVLGGRVGKGINTPLERVEDANTTIANIKVGARLDLLSSSHGDGWHSIYLGYGRALTGAQWYDDVIRAEIRLAF
ncbi:hypothetical protein [Stieleria varia]|uniref:Uncharacterized protein n=1 Tax=Stieleria varia TaxID=2528005 RepID=A0A5C6B219_9BACT|nr:hypothetical protein [Stieleria varia]TWU05462.1 hypothetical protein Pla52n_11740 [Stieleria varia]